MTIACIQALETASETGIYFGYLNLQGANLEQIEIHANLSNTVLLEADLSYTDLQGADLSHADLTIAKLTGANLKGENLSGANLTETNLKDVDLSLAHLENTISPLST